MLPLTHFNTHHVSLADAQSQIYMTEVNGFLICVYGIDIDVDILYYLLVLVYRWMRVISVSCSPFQLTIFYSNVPAGLVTPTDDEPTTNQMCCLITTEMRQG